MEGGATHCCQDQSQDRSGGSRVDPRLKLRAQSGSERLSRRAKKKSEVILARASTASTRRRFGEPQAFFDMGIVHELDKSGFNANGIKHDKRSRPLLAHAELSGQEVRQIRQVSHQLPTFC